MAQQYLKKSKNQWIGGVLGGIANYFDLNPDALRIAFLILLIVLDFGILIPAYIIMLILMPDGDEHIEEKNRKSCEISVRTWRILGIILIIAGIGFLVENQLGLPWMRIRYYLSRIQHTILPSREMIIALAMIGGGIWLVSRNRD